MPPLPVISTFIHEDTLSRERTRDKALLITIEYKRHPHKDVHELETYQDAERMRQHLIEHWGYLAHNITVLSEDDEDENMVPTRDNIFREIDNLVEDTKPGDRRVFFFAGHCYQIKNRRGTELDDLDEVILTAKHNGPPDPAIDYPLAHEVRRGLVIDNELRERLVNCIPCGAKLVAIADTCHSGTLFDLNWHWHCDSQDPNKMRTLPSPPLTGMVRRPPRRVKVHGKAQEYAYRSDTHEGGATSQSGSHRVKTLFSSQDAQFSPQSDSATSEVFDDTEAFGDFPMCTSPTQEMEPEVVSISSADDSQKAWSGKEDSMTALLVQLLEELGQRRVPLRELTHLLNRKMRGARRQTMEAYYERRRSSMKRCTLEALNRIQVPQLGGLSKDAPHALFEL